MSEVDEEVELENGPFVYQASVTFWQPCEDIVFLKAYNREQAEQIIQENFGQYKDLQIKYLTLSTSDTTQSLLKGNSN